MKQHRQWQLYAYFCNLKQYRDLVFLEQTDVKQAGEADLSMRRK